jgi:type I restriction enzyme, S subunit
MTHTLCVLKPDRQQISPRYLLHYARSPLFLEGLLGTMNPNVGVPTLGLQVIRNATIPLGTIAEQRRITNRLDSVLSCVRILKDMRSETAAKLDALLPSILDTVFRAEI